MDPIIIIIAIKQIEHVLRQRLDERLAPLKITLPKWVVLRRIQEQPNASGAEIARLSFISPQAANLIIVGLQEQNMIERRVSQKDSRFMEMQITEYGKDILQQCQLYIQEAAEEMLQNLSDDQQEQLFSLLTLCFNTLTGESLIPPALKEEGR